MSVAYALLLALVQGITEFLPISSAAHLILLPWLIGGEDQGLTFDAAANTGTLFAVLLYFRVEMAELARLFVRRVAEPRRKLQGPTEDLLWKLAAATLPVGIVGWLVQDWVAEQARNPVLIGWTSILFGLVLGLADRFGRKGLAVEELRWRSAIGVGLAQAVALVPGVSRAGITMTAGLASGLSREAAARFSFLLYVPVSVLVAIKDLLDLGRGAVVFADLMPLAVTFLGSAMVGYAVIALLLAWLRRRSLQVFVVYRVLLGVAILALVWRG
jgi:undecaprenyl-diphosphatase